MIRFDRATGDVLIKHGHRVTRDVGMASAWLARLAGDVRAAEVAVLENYARGRDDGIPSAWAVSK